MRGIQVRCSGCGSPHVQYTAWVNANTLQVMEEYGEWKSIDTKWCNDCQDHVRLYDKDCDPEAFKLAKQTWEKAHPEDKPVRRKKS